jgi:ATP-dependent exoDNAse (exonuclease V) beta subunit
LARFVAWLIRDSGWTVEERGERVPVDSRHVCLLFRRFKHFRDDATRPYQRALEARHVPHVLVGGRSFHDREEVIALRNALTAIEWPGDELSVYAALRGPLFALTDDVLLAWRAAVGTIHPLAPRRTRARSRVAGGRGRLDVLAYLHRGRNRRPIADTVGQLLEAGARARGARDLADRRAGARELSARDGSRAPLRAPARLRSARSSTGSRRTPRAARPRRARGEEGTEGVRIMTAHRAKGLEFPVVVLCDPTAKATREQPSRHVDPERSLWAEPLAGCAPRELLERARSSSRATAPRRCGSPYVAATRARDLLVVTGVADEELENSWIAALHPAISHPARARRGRARPGLPRRSAESPAGERPNHAKPASALRCTRAASHRGPADTRGVVGSEGIAAGRAGARRPAPAARPRGR